jgi:hypothetical protein
VRQEQLALQQQQQQQQQQQHGLPPGLTRSSSPRPNSPISSPAVGSGVSQAAHATHATHAAHAAQAITTVPTVPTLDLDQVVDDFSSSVSYSIKHHAVMQ